MPLPLWCPFPAFAWVTWQQHGDRNTKPFATAIDILAASQIAFHLVGTCVEDMNFGVRIYIGEEITVRSEIDAIAQFDSDLRKSGIGALILANFEVEGRQIDFIVVTKYQATMLELKSFTGKVVGGMNGPWILRDYDGIEKEYAGKNPYRQALDAKFRISSAMGKFHRQTGVGAAAERSNYYTFFDSIVCIWPKIDESSLLEDNFKCRVMGYAEAIKLISTREISPRWSEEDWIAFALHLGLRPTTLLSAISPPHREAEQILTSYQAAFIEGISVTLLPELPDLAFALPKDEHALLYGHSGIGKTIFLNRHIYETAKGTKLVLLCLARHYGDSFKRLLARSIAPFSSAAPSELLNAALQSGWEIILVVDGIDGFDAKRERDLINGIVAFVRRYKARVIISAINPLTLPPSVSGAAIQFPPLTEEQKLSIFNFHTTKGRVPPADFLTTFSTAHDIMVAAKSTSFVDAKSSRAIHYAAYVTESIPPKEHTPSRAILLRIAHLFHSEFRKSMEFGHYQDEARRVLSESGDRLTIADNVAKLPQVTSDRGSFSFAHDLWQDFFASEYLVASSLGTKSLAIELSKPLNKRLVANAVGRLREPESIRAVLAETCDAALLADGLSGGLGSTCKTILEQICAEIWGTLREDVRNWRLDPIERENPGPPFSVILVGPRKWNKMEQSVIDWLSERLHFPDIADEFLNAVEVASTMLWQISEAIANGDAGSSRHYFNDALRSLYTFCGPNIPATVFSQLRVWGSTHYLRPAEERDYEYIQTCIAERLKRCSKSARVGLLLCLIVCVHRNKELSVECIEIGFHQAWKERVNQLRIELLNLIEDRGRELSLQNTKVADGIRLVLEGVLGQNAILNTFVYPAINALRQMEPPVSTAEARRELRAIIDSSSEEYRKEMEVEAELRAQFPSEAIPNYTTEDRAHGFVSRFWDEIFQGVYWEVYNELNRSEQIRFLNMAAVSDQCEVECFILRELVQACEPSSGIAFAFHARRIRLEESMWQDAIAKLCLGTIGCARLGLTLPEWLGKDIHAPWRIIRELIYNQHSKSSDHETGRQWMKSLLSETARRSADALFLLRQSQSSVSRGDREGKEDCWRFLLSYNTEMRELMEWSLQKQDELISCLEYQRPQERARFIVETLKDVGNSVTVSLLRSYVDDSVIGESSVQAIESINRRLTLG